MSGLVLGAALASSHCKSVESCAESATCPIRPEAGADGGPDAADDPSDNGDFALRVTTPNLTLTHGRTERVEVILTRKGGFSKAVAITAKGLPAGLAANTITLDPATATGELVLTVDATAKQGVVTGAAVVATEVDGQSSVDAPLELFVRGAPGEIDTTFATNGVLSPPVSPTGTEFALDAEGRIYVGTEGKLQRYSSEGAVDSSFAPTVTGPKRSVKLVVQPNAVFWGRNSVDLKAFTLEKYSISGNALDTSSYGAGSGYFTDGFPLSALAVAGDGRGNTFLRRSADWASHFLTPAGTLQFGNPTHSTIPAIVRESSPIGDAFVFVGDAHIGRHKVQGAGAGYDPSFASVGYLQVAGGVRLNDVVVDSAGRYLVTGYNPSSQALYLARVTSSGVLDGSFTAVTGTFIVKPEAIADSYAGADGSHNEAGRLAIAADGKILQAAQIEAAGSTKCVVLRFDPNGNSDATFGNQGQATLPPSECVARRIGLQPDGRVIVGGPIIVRVWN
jgi:uncharacterized delta-60 repeat protein